MSTEDLMVAFKMLGLQEFLKMAGVEEEEEPIEEEEEETNPYEPCDFDLAYDCLIDYCIASEEEIGVACHFSGRSLETLEELLYYKTGYRDFAEYYHDELSE